MKQRGSPLCPCCRRDFVIDPLDDEEAAARNNIGDDGNFTINDDVGSVDLWFKSTIRVVTLFEWWRERNIEMSLDQVLLCMETVLASIINLEVILVH